MDKSGIFGEVSEALGGVVKQATKQVVKTPVDLTKTAVSQVKGDVGVPESLGSNQQQSGQNVQKPSDVKIGDKKLDQEMKDQQDLAKARNELHSLYYQKLTNPVKQEERAVEKLEREEKEKKFEDLQERSRKPQGLPQNVKQGTGEKVVGISG